MATAFSPAMERALYLLRYLLDEGVEWPDAVFKVTQKTGLMSFEVERAWDIRERGE